MPFNRCIYAYMDLAAQPREAIAEIDRRYCILHASIKPKESEHRWLRFKKKKPQNDYYAYLPSRTGDGCSARGDGEGCRAACCSGTTMPATGGTSAGLLTA